MLLLCIFSLQAQTYDTAAVRPDADTIKAKNTEIGIVFSYKGDLFSSKEVTEVMKICPEAYKAMLKANRQFSIYFITGILASAFSGAAVGWMIGAFLRGTGVLISDVIIFAANGALGISFGIMSVTFRNKYRKTLYSAVDIFNRNARQLTSARSITLDLGLTCSGVGVKVNF
jgi:hypothetical protein